MNSNPLVSVIIPVFNDEKFIVETLESVKSQTYTNWEVILVNDGSTDKSESIIIENITDDSRFNYFLKSNSGVSETRNEAIKKAKGIYILPLDSDDLIAKDYIKDAVTIFEKNPETKLVYCRANFFGEVNKEFKLSKYKYEDLLLRNSIFCSAFYKKEDFLKTNGYDKNLKLGLEDWEFWIQFLNKNSIVIRLNKIHFFYRIKANSRNTIHSNETKIREIQDYIYEKHKEKYDSILFNNKPKIEELYKIFDTNKKFEQMKKSIFYTLFKLVREIKKPFISN